MKTPTVPLRVMIESLIAAHLSSYVSSPFRDRSGVILVGPPAVFKSAMLDVVERHFPDALMLSDVNIPSLIALRDQIAQGAIRTLLLSELAKIYRRDPRTAENIEGTLQAMVAEGFRAAAFEDSRINRLVARCTIIGAIPPAEMTKQFVKWESSGFSRRFLFPTVGLEHPEVAERAVSRWELIDFDSRLRVPPMPAGGVIPNLTTKAERDLCGEMVRFQPGGRGAHASQKGMLVKMLAATRWWYKVMGRDPKRAIVTIKSFALTLGRGGALLRVPEPLEKGLTNGKHS